MNRTFASLGVVAALCISSAVRADPAATLSEHGCLACHSLDGSRGPGPTLQGVAARDEAYLRRSIREPDAEIATGYRAGAMPKLDLADSDVDALVGAMRALPSAAPAPRLATNWILALGCLGFVIAHFGLSAHPLRSRLVGRLGEQKFQGVYSLLVLAAFGAMIAGWRYRVFVPLWEPPPFTRLIPLSVMPIAYVFLLAGFTTRNATSAGQESASEGPPRGIVSVTRHPALWGFALWGLAHLGANGDLASVLLFSSIVVLSIGGMLHIDRRRARTLGERWAPFARATSIVPFAAILAGRTKLDTTGLGWRVALALALFGASLLTHEWLLGVTPLPY